MFSLLGKLFGSEKVIQAGINLIDDMHTSTEEEIVAKTNAKVALLQAYAPFKIAQRYIALIFTGIFSFIMLNGVLGSLYGFIDLSAVEDAKQFANSMWLGEIMLTIVGFYFGGGLAESIRNKSR